MRRVLAIDEHFYEAERPKVAGELNTLASLLKATNRLAEAELQQARERFEAAQKLAALPLDQPTGELMDQMLGPARSADDVLKELDEQYRKDGRPDFWFLTLDEPISPHLNELLGPIETEKLDAQAK